MRIITVDPDNITILSGTSASTRHKVTFVLPSKPENPRFADTEALHQAIVILRSEGKSYRQIAREVGLHWTRVGQILKGRSRARR